MATKTISIEIDVYDQLRARKRTASESFSQVLRRVLSVPKVVTGADIVKLIESGKVPKVLSDEDLDRLEELQRE
ncbi:MAG: antitoxin VapB family protein [Fimbriimonadales bacterium]